jgi:hypothetical protein
MNEASVQRVGDLPGDELARHRFALVTMRGKPGWPDQ